MTDFDCFNAELLCEIFDYLSFTDIFLAFFNLQQRIDNVVRAYPACIDLSNTTDRNALVHGPFLCRALIVWVDDSQKNPIDYLYFNFEAIRAIEFKYVNSTLLQSICGQLPMQQLESITIDDLDMQDDSNGTDQQIWSIIATAGQYKLRYLRTTLRVIQRDVEQLLLDLPSLQHATLKRISTKEMLAFLRHTPSLCSFTGRLTTWNNDNYTSDLCLHRLTHLDLHIESCRSFGKLRQLLSICPYLTHFVLQFRITGNNVAMLDATEWRLLVEECLPHLTYLKIRLFRYERIMNDSDSDSDGIFDLSEYWLKRQPQFDIKVRLLLLMAVSFIEDFIHKQKYNPVDCLNM
jgi:hypothetical protein